MNRREARRYFKLAADRGFIYSIKTYKDLTKYTTFSL